MDLHTIGDAFDHITKKQKLSSSKIKDKMDQICHEVENALTRIQSSPDSGSEVDTNSILSELNAKLIDLSPLSQQEGTEREFNMTLSKYSKLLEKSLNPYIMKAYGNVDFDTHIIDHIIASHFYHQGMFNIGDSFIAEANAPEAAAFKSQFLELHQILSAMATRNIEPALAWASANHDKLSGNGSELVVRLHRLRFVEMLRNSCWAEAIKYARASMSSFATSHMAQLLKLMGCLAFAKRLDHSPYSDFSSPHHWDTVAKDLMQEFCNMFGQSYESPLSTTIATGVQALPQLLKLMKVVVDKKRDDWQSIKHLPVPFDLDKEFQFHSIFVCPVSKDQASEENPPMLMSCGHVLCRQSIAKMSKNNTKLFKCPYCPLSLDPKLCKQLYF